MCHASSSSGCRSTRRCALWARRLLRITALAMSSSLTLCHGSRSRRACAADSRCRRASNCGSRCSARSSIRSRRSRTDIPASGRMSRTADGAESSSRCKASISACASRNGDNPRQSRPNSSSSRSARPSNTCAPSASAARVRRMHFLASWIPECRASPSWASRVCACSSCPLANAIRRDPMAESSSNEVVEAMATLSCGIEAILMMNEHHEDRW